MDGDRPGGPWPVVRAGGWWAVVSPDGRTRCHYKTPETAAAAAAALGARWGGHPPAPPAGVLRLEWEIGGGAQPPAPWDAMGDEGG